MSRGYTAFSLPLFNKSSVKCKRWMKNCSNTRKHVTIEAAGHSIECITDANHSIALNKTVLCGCRRRESRARPSRCATTQPQPQTIPFLVYSKVIPCTMFEHFMIIFSSYAADKQAKNRNRRPRTF